MPCTFCHPIAVVPLRRWCPDPLNLAALVIGSMSPDFGYYFGQFPIAHFAHSILGTFLVCLPGSLLAIGIFYTLRRPLCFVLPEPHRSALTPLALRKVSLSWRSFLVTALCIMLGAWTHTIWDSFTHDGGWAAERFAILRASVVHIGGTNLPISYLLQQTSSLGAGVLLVVLYFRWLSRQPTPARVDGAPASNRWRYALLGSLAVVALMVAIPMALRLASLFEGYLAFRVFIFRTGVSFAAVFILLLTVSSMAVYYLHRKGA